CIYVTHAYRLLEATPVLHAAALRDWGSWLPWAWPHDGLQHDKGSGEQLAEQYRRQGLRMLEERAQFEDGTNGEWVEEFRLYHRKDGKVVKERDDLMSATRYGLMMLRHAATAPDALAR